MKIFLVLFALVFCFTACQPENRIYHVHQELSPDLEWLKEDVKEFEVAIKDNSVPYDMSLTFRYATGYQFQTANIKVTETSPSGKISVKEYKLKVREENGDYIGEPGYDIWDSQHLVEEDKQYEETGVYTYKMEQVTPADPLNFAMEIGLILDKVVQ